MRYRVGKVRKLGLLHGSWLDCGCADGGFTVALAESGATEVTGIDIEEERIHAAQERFSGRLDVRFVCGRSEALPFDDAAFDGVFCNEVLEHVADESRTLREIHRVLRPGGSLVLMTPNRIFPFEGHGLRLTPNLAVPGPVPLVPWIPARITRPFMEARGYWPWTLRDFVSRHGFDIREVGSALPVFEVRAWLPAGLVRFYRRNIFRLENVPVVRYMGASVFVVASKH